MTEKLIYTILISFITAILVGPVLIPILKKMKFGQVVRNDGPETHLKKSGTPTMGGLIIILATLVGVLMFTNNFCTNVLIFIFGFIGFSIIGFLDDYIKVVLKRSTGLRAWQKALLQLAMAIVLSYFIYKNVGGGILIPFVRESINIGWWIIPFAVFVLLATTNSTNLTDGLDGLLTSVSLVFFLAYTIILSGNGFLNDGNLAVISAAIAGSLLGFLRFNSYPAKVFMGDTGSLAIGGGVGMVALLSKSSLWIPLMGFLFVASSISVILQVGAYKLRKKRIFKMAPLHHHFEQLGYHEVKITVMYTIVTIILCLIGIIAFVI